MEERLDLLLSANVITQQAHSGCIKALAIIDQQLSIDHSSEQYQMALTHLARAADRVRQNEAVEEGLDQEVFDEILDDPNYPAVLALHQRVLDAMELSSVPKEEESFLLANIYALFHVAEEGQP